MFSYLRCLSKRFEVVGRRAPLHARSCSSTCRAGNIIFWRKGSFACTLRFLKTTSGRSWHLPKTSEVLSTIKVWVSRYQRAWVICHDACQSTIRYSALPTQPLPATHGLKVVCGQAWTWQRFLVGISRETRRHTSRHMFFVIENTSISNSQ